MEVAFPRCSASLITLLLKPSQSLRTTHHLIKFLGILIVTCLFAISRSSNDSSVRKVEPPQSVYNFPIDFNAPIPEFEELDSFAFRDDFLRNQGDFLMLENSGHSFCPSSAPRLDSSRYCLISFLFFKFFPQWIFILAQLIPSDPLADSREGVTDSVVN